MRNEAITVVSRRADYLPVFVNFFGSFYGCNVESAQCIPIREYCDLLKESPWESEVWGRLQMKMRFICTGALVPPEYLDVPVAS